MDEPISAMVAELLSNGKWAIELDTGERRDLLLVVAERDDEGAKRLLHRGEGQRAAACATLAPFRETDDDFSERLRDALLAARDALDCIGKFKLRFEGEDGDEFVRWFMHRAIVRAMVAQLLRRAQAGEALATERLVQMGLRFGGRYPTLELLRVLPQIEPTPDPGDTRRHIIEAAIRERSTDDPDAFWWLVSQRLDALPPDPGMVD